MGNKCIIPTKKTAETAEQIERDPKRVPTDIGVWQEKNDTSAQPSATELQVSIQETQDNKHIEEQVSKRPKVEIYEGYWTREEVEKATDKVFLFGDNTEDRTVTHHIPHLTQAVIRGLPNAIGIDTKRNRRTDDGTTKTINIYAGTGENAELSNFAERPFKYDTTLIPVSDTEVEYKSKFVSDYKIHMYPLELAANLGLTFKTVEGAFQAAKLGYVKQPNGYDFTIKSPYYEDDGEGLAPTQLLKDVLTKLANASGAEARRIGRTIQDLQVEKWDKDSSAIMKVLIGQSFEQNPEALKKLIATGNAVLTHTQDKGKWGTEFPKILMEVREELGGQAPSTSNNSSYFTDADFDQFKVQVDDAIAQAKASGKTIVIPAKGIGTGAAQLQQRAPKLFEYLVKKLDQIVSTPRTQEQTQKEDKNDEYVPEEITFNPAEPKISKEAVAEKLVMLNSLFTPQQLSNRIKNISEIFSKQIDVLYNRKIRELKKQLKEAKKGSLEAFKASNELVQLEDSKMGRTVFAQQYLNISETIEEVKKDIAKTYNALRSETPSEEEKDQHAYKLDQYRKMYYAADYLMVLALSDIEANEGIRIVMSQRNTASKKTKLVGEKYIHDEDLIEEDDDYARVVSGNSGWAFKQREADPHTSLTQNVRRILRKIPMLSDTGELMKDDIGRQRYMDSEYVYATILNGCTWMIDADDFHKVERDEQGNKVLDEDGNAVFSLPAIDELAKKYKWMEGVKRYLLADEDLVSEFYSCFRMDYIPYYMLSVGKFAPVNKEMSLANAFDAIVRNYEVGNTLTKDSLFDSSGKINRENARKGSELAEQLMKDLSNDDWNEDSFSSLKQLLNMLGTEVDVSLNDFLNFETGDVDKDKMNYLSVSKLLSNIKSIFDNIDELQPNEHLVNHFQGEYTNIARIIGSVTMFNRHMTFRQGDKDYPSYSTPNFATTTMKRLLSPDSNRRKEIFDFYKQTGWFYGENGWRNFVLQQLEANDALVEELRDGCLVNMNTIRVQKQSPIDSIFEQTEAIPYEEWTPAQIKHIFIKAYFSAGHSTSSSQQYGYYYFPIFADTICAMFMKFLRFNENYEQKILPLLRQVVLQELGRQKLVQERAGKADEIANFDANGDKFFFFQSLNSYKSKVEYEVMEKYYSGIIKEAKEAGNNKVAKVATGRLAALTADREGMATVPFKDAVKAYRRNNDIEKVNVTIDTALLDIMEKEFNDFLSDNVLNNIPLIQSLVEDNIIPKSELEKARKNAENGNILQASVEVTKEDLEGTKEEQKEAAAYSTLREAAREFFWNNTLMQTQIVEVMTVDLAFNKADGGIDFQKRFKEVFASGRKLDTNSKYGKTFEKVVYLKDRVRMSRVYNFIRGVFNEAEKEGRITKRQKEEILAQFEEVNSTDAQAFRSLSSMRSVLDMAGMWTEQMEATFNHIQNGTVDASDMSVMWQTIKPFMFTILEKEDGLGGKLLVPHHHKNSEFLLLEAYAFAEAAIKNTAMSALNKFMEANDIDVVMYESAVKVGAENVIDISISTQKINNLEDSLWKNIEDAAKQELKTSYKEGRTKENLYAGLNRLLKDGKLSQSEYNDILDSVEPSEEEILQVLEDACYTQNEAGQRVENPNTVHTVPYSAYMIATPTPEHWVDTRVVDGSQKRNLLYADLPKGQKFNVNGTEKTSEEVVDLADKIIVENLLDDHEEVRETLKSKKNLQESLLAQIKGNPKYSRDFTNALSLKTTETGKVDFAIPVDFPSIRNKIAELVLSKFKNGITKQKAKGGTCILVADTQNRLNIILEDGSILDTKDPAAVAKAKKHNLIKGFECYLPAWSKALFERYLKTVTRNGQTWQEIDIEKIKEEAPDLLYMSGIRIPTEDKYSITPLIVKGFLPIQQGSAIMLPADLTTIAGIDFDVDKMFIRLYHFRTNEDGKLEKIQYDYSKDPKDNTREQRENALLDIELAIIRNESVAEALFNPGNFDPIKVHARRTQILSETSDDGRSLFTIWQEEHGIDYANIEEAFNSVYEASLSELKKFVERFEKKREIWNPNTFIYNHQQNMAGAALIGIYANNTTAQAKTQTTRLAIREAYTFHIEGRKIQSLHDTSFIKNGIASRISKICALFSDASVDNVKDPCLRKIGQTPKTAYITNFMIRAGMDVEEISCLFAQPFVALCINTRGDVPKAKQIVAHIEKLNEKYKTSVDPNKLVAELNTHNFTVKELMTNIVKYNRYRNLEEREIDVMPLSERTELVKNIALALELFARITKLATQLRGSVKISRADSPNGAASNELHKVNDQIRDVDIYMANQSAEGWGIDYISDIMSNNVISVMDSKDKKREKLLDKSKVKIPRLQAFYSLGIESIPELLSPYFMSQSKECQDIINKIHSVVAYPLSEKEEEALYNDFITYILSGTDEFGNSEEGTFEEKRDYYLYQYPQKFAEILHTDLAKTPALANLRVTNGQIVLERSGKVTPPLRDSLIRGFDSLLFGSEEAQQVAYDLFRYAFYNEGLIPRHNSYGQFFSVAFLSCFDEALSSLRTTPDAARMEAFFEQWVAQKNNIGHFRELAAVQGVNVMDDGSISVDEENIPMRPTGAPEIYIVYKGGLYMLSQGTEAGAIYSPVPLIDAGPTEGRMHKFNAKQDASQVAAAEVSQERIENLRKLNAVSIRQQSFSERKSGENKAATENLVEEAENPAQFIPDEESFAPEIEPPAGFIDDVDFYMEFTDDASLLDFADKAQEEYDEALGQKTLTDLGQKPLC